MSPIERAEQLKQEFTDKYVVVNKNVPELKRFANRTGVVKTVNMNGRALVQFDGPEDISWYDIAPEYLTIVDSPQPKKKEAKPAPAQKAPAKQKPAAKQAAPAKSAPSGKQSPLELARQQDADGQAATKAETAKPPESDTSDKPPESGKPAAAPPAETSGKKLSPLELARMQDAGRKAAKTEPSAEAKETPEAEATPDTKKTAQTKQPEAPSAPAPSAESSGKNLSPLELARMQDSGGGVAKQAESPATEPEETSPPTSQADTAPTEQPSAPASTAASSDKQLSPLELARMQDAGGGAAQTTESAPAGESTETPAQEPAAEDDTAEADQPAEASAEPPAEQTDETSAEEPSSAGGFVPTPGDTASIIALAREQGAWKGD